MRPLLLVAVAAALLGVAHGLVRSDATLPPAMSLRAASKAPTVATPLARIDGSSAVVADNLRMKGGKSSLLQSIKDSLFPVEGWEMPKFFSMSLMMFMIIYIYTTVRDTKDTLVVSQCGAESITFLKVYGVLPAATLFMVYYSKISTVFDKKALFYVTAAPFLAFYALFAWVLYPMRETIHFPMPANVDERYKYPVSLLCNWSYSLFYIVSELWGSVGVSVLFWQLANDIIPVWQAQRFYPLFGQLANIAPICAGQTVAYFAKICPTTATARSGRR
ncbi:TLC ATP/ADP transporter-domain-containing protein [Baffinella frigidus]|nr:TLC ATP/ADP transporter-domain-containing protein [Cryptophyta sp. CCMP2293]